AFAARALMLSSTSRDQASDSEGSNLANVVTLGRGRTVPRALVRRLAALRVTRAEASKLRAALVVVREAARERRRDASLHDYVMVGRGAAFLAPRDRARDAHRAHAQELVSAGMLVRRIPRVPRSDGAHAEARGRAEVGVDRDVDALEADERSVDHRDG